VHGGVGDDVFEALELAHDQSAVRWAEQDTVSHWELLSEDMLEPVGGWERPTPWTRVGDIEMVAVLLGRELRAGFSGNPVAEDGLLALEFA
jgi:hypothetical protein